MTWLGQLFYKQILLIFLIHILVGICIWAPKTNASVQIMFFKQQTHQGDIVQFEPGGQFVHTAISFKNGWLHAHPYYGVQVVSTSEVQKMGSESAVMILHDLPALKSEDIQSFLGKKFDPYFSWDDDRIYCSELIAKLLHIPPSAMFFDPQLWPKEYQKYNGKLGISPDDIAQYFTDMGYFMQPNLPSK